MDQGRQVGGEDDETELPSVPRERCAVSAGRRFERTNSMRCCMEDEGGPLAVALQEEAANHRKVRRSRAVRAERCGKGAT